MTVDFDFYQKFMTINPCYKQGLKLAKNKCTGIMVHSTDAKGAMAAAWFKRWNIPVMIKPKLVAAFIDDKECWQYAPWDMFGAHCGGAANRTHIGFEICEDDDWTREYFVKAYRNAVQLAAYLCALYGLTEKNIVSHKEGNALGIASNHGDPDHWWKKFGVTMDDFRKDVKTLLSSGTITLDIKGMDTEMSYYKVIVDANDTLNVRDAPSNTGTILKTYAPGQLITVLEESSSGWFRTADGWCYSGYLQKVETVSIVLPVAVAAGLKSALEAAL